MVSLIHRPASDSAAGTDHKMGLSQSTALIVGSIIGVGIFSLPYSLASYGPISLLAMAIASVAAIAFALLFAALSRRIPADGGPYAYSRTAFGNGVGFGNAWSYWITAWAGNAAIAVGWVYYVEHFINKGGSTAVSILIAFAGLWIPAAVNISGLRNVGAFQVVTTVLKFLPLAFLATIGLFYISAGNFTPWNTSGDTNMSAIGGAMAICLFAYLGVETAAVAAANVRDPKHNIPRATVFGTLASAVVYMLSLIAVFGILPTAALALDENKASYAVATNSIFGGTWSGDLVAIAVIISGIGALNGWTMICAEMPRAAAKDGLFPKQFAELSSRGAPVFGIVSSTLFASIAVLISFWGTNGSTVFTTLVLMTGITAAIPFGFSALAQIVWRLKDREVGNAAHFTRDMVVAVASVAASIGFIYYSRNVDASWYVVWGPFLMTGGALLVGVPVYLSQRRHMTEPAAVPAYDGSVA
ncbi:amino acid permease [Aeromicrobium sp. 9AM]|uniref:amino acid permease n=1 Tax=Aeromicrobium sp. 9AM TaxID=2653126 RepID=UPI0012EFD25C|nr:amino acid permease [Aeromicrobium sp. 9AM]VXC11965.1 Amino acid permease [Aeromicrobium sp. 9AM]